MTEVEYMALTKIVMEAICLRDLVSDLGLVQGMTPEFCDRHSVIDLLKNPVYHKSTKHIDVRYNFFREIMVIQV